MKKLLIFACCLIGINAGAQQDPMYTQFFSNKIVVNPAYAGTREAISFVGLYRNQWTGFDGAPKTTTLSIHSPINTTNSGLGLSLVYDQLGIQRNYSVKGAYAYRLQLPFGHLSMGVDAEFKKQDMLWNESNPLQTGDMEIPYGQNSLFLPNFGAGLYLYDDNYYVGISAPKLLENELNYENVNPNGNAIQRRHYFAMAGVLIPLSNKFALKPAVLAKYEHQSPLEMDFNVIGIFNERFWLGATYRTNDSFDALVQYHLPSGLRIGYAYDFTLTDLSRANSGSHEIMIGFDFNKQKKGLYHPRYF